MTWIGPCRIVWPSSSHRTKDVGSSTKKNLKMFDADDKNTFGNCDVLELLPGRSYPSDSFGIVAIDKKFRHGLLESLWSIGAQVRHEIGMEQLTLQPHAVSKSLPPFQRLSPREHVTNSLCGWWEFCKRPVPQEEFWTLQVLVYCRLL